MSKFNEIDTSVEVLKKSFQLWKEVSEWENDLFIYNYERVRECFFCGEYQSSKPNHRENCIWVQAKKLVEIYKNV